MLTKPELFDTRRSFLLTALFFVSVLSIRLGFSYAAYSEFISKPFYFTNAVVLNAYEKSKYGKKYTVVKLHSDEGLTFYTTTHSKQNLLHSRVRIKIFPNASIPFYKYLGTFYVKSRIQKITALPQSFKTQLLQKVAMQHESREMQQFYNAIFFATPVDKVLREKIALLGVSHLVALSGFHLGILWGMIYGFLLLLYTPLQRRKFPYRFALIDMGLLTIVLLGVYVWFVGSPPSLVRSYAMLVVGWAAVVTAVELLSFTLLATIGLGLLAFFPSLLVSLSFWLSMSGVFYIFLLLHYGQAYNKWVISLLFIPFGIFVLMLPVVHTIFAVTSVYQLFSPLLSLLFIPFYPLAMLLHLLGLGGSLDAGLLWLFSLPKGGSMHLLPWWLGAGYAVVSLTAVRYTNAFYALLVIAVGYAAYLFVW